MQLDPTQQIHLLPENIIDQIKAGEVIERPATLLKELLENSIDAGSTKVKITIENNGLDLIIVSDNGHGISFDDLPLAFYRHATSKIQKFEDLYNLFSYGFRGEALASMASVSKITCTTTNKYSSSTIKIEGGQILSHQKSEIHNEDLGTELFVKDLFYNTPARLKFISSKTSELNQLKKMIASFVLTKPEVEFLVKLNDNARKTYPIENDFTNRINSLLFPKSHQEFHTNLKSYDDIEVKIYLSKSSGKGNSGKQQFIFVNDRYIQDQTIHRIICNSANQVWQGGMVGHYIVYIKTLPHMVDVNVHPNKINIKFHTPAKIHALISQTIKEIKLPEIQVSNASGSQDQLQQRPSTNFEYHGTKFEHLLDNPVDKTKLFNSFALTNRYAVTTMGKNQYLLDLLSLALFIIEGQGPESQIIPLMVSAPIRDLELINDEIIDKMASKGFELSKLGTSTIALKGYPESLDAFDCTWLAEIILRNHDFSKGMNFNSLLVSLDQCEIDSPIAINLYDLSKISSNLNFDSAIKNKIIKEFTDKNLSKLFYE